MDIKLTLVLVLFFLIILLLFYYVNLESNIIILLGIVIILLLNNLITNSEHFQASVPDTMFLQSPSSISSMQDKQGVQIDNLLEVLTTLIKKNESENVSVLNENFPPLPVENSCVMDDPSKLSTYEQGSEQTNTENDAEMIQLPDGSNMKATTVTDFLQNLKGLY